MLNVVFLCDLVFAIYRDVEKFEFFRLTLCSATTLTIHSASNFTPEESRSIKTIIKVCGSRRFFIFFSKSSQNHRKINAKSSKIVEKLLVRRRATIQSHDRRHFYLGCCPHVKQDKCAKQQRSEWMAAVGEFIFARSLSIPKSVVHLFEQPPASIYRYRFLTYPLHWSKRLKVWLPSTTKLLEI